MYHEQNEMYILLSLCNRDTHFKFFEFGLYSWKRHTLLQQQLPIITILIEKSFDFSLDHAIIKRKFQIHGEIIHF